MDPRQSILLVDDDDFTRHYLRQVLSEDRYQFLEASNGADALGIIAKMQPDLVLLDLLMPKMGGMEVLLALQECQKRPAVMVISSLNTHKLVEEALRAGALGFIAKPFEETQVTEKVAGALRA
jgi:two-component system, chemotaxis family, chemotaxis protein CheY